MGSINWNMLHFNSLCSQNNEDKTTEKNIKEYEDSHIKITFENIKERVNGQLKNEINHVSINNKDGYYNPKALLAPGTNYYLTKGD